ncbi:MAG TPA: restriction endonuclease [Trebonia sp.]|nr:restriction endonuclease [Trebonia sp.]
MEAEVVMAQKRSLWSELQRELERREKAALARQRAEQQTIRQLMQEQVQAERRAVKADAAEKKRQEALAHEAGAAAADAMRKQLEARVTELSTILTSVLQSSPQLPFGALKRRLQVPPFDPGNDGTPERAPLWEDFEPSPLGVMSGILGGKVRHARAVEAAQATYEKAVADHGNREAARLSRLRRAAQAHDVRVRELQAEVRAHNAGVNELETKVLDGVPDAVEEYFTEVLALSQYPSGFTHQYQVAYRPEPRELVIEYRLPPAEIIPPERDFKYVKTRREIDKVPRPIRDVKQLYASVVQQVALRTMWECFAVPEGRDVVEAVVFNGIATAINRATGHDEEVHLVSAPASRTEFEDLVLDRLDPESCLKRLKAILSPHPYDLEAVEPVIEFEKAKYRFAEPVDALEGIDSRPDLLKMDWYRFENLVRQLFEAMGLEVRITQSSRDEGIDVVAYNKADIVHKSEMLIQAKRYSRCVPANDVRALAASVDDKRATVGILVTTAWVGPESKSFAARNRVTIIEGGELKHLLAEHLNLDVRIDIGRPSRRKP